MKACKKCLQSKPYAEFSINRQLKDGYFNSCKICVEAHRQTRMDEERENRRRWKAANPDKLYESNLKYYLANREKCDKATAKWWRDNPEKKAIKDARYHANNRAARGRKTRLWQIKNPEKTRAATAKRRAIERGAPGFHTPEDIVAILEYQRHRCANPHCAADLRISKPNLDHRVALINGGSNSPDNLQWLCEPCNKSKGSKDEDIWLASPFSRRAA